MKKPYWQMTRTEFAQYVKSKLLECPMVTYENVSVGDTILDRRAGGKCYHVTNNSNGNKIRGRMVSRGGKTDEVDVEIPRIDDGKPIEYYSINFLIVNLGRGYDHYICEAVRRECDVPHEFIADCSRYIAKEFNEVVIAIDRYRRPASTTNHTRLSFRDLDAELKKIIRQGVEQNSERLDQLALLAPVFWKKNEISHEEIIDSLLNINVPFIVTDDSTGLSIIAPSRPDREDIYPNHWSMEEHNKLINAVNSLSLLISCQVGKDLKYLTEQEGMRILTPELYEQELPHEIRKLYA